MSKFRVALIGISGFGGAHLEVIKRLEDKEIITLEAVCEKNLEANADKINELTAKGVTCYNDYMEMLDCHGDIDIVAVSTPIHLHREMAVNIMGKGMNVILEKPPAVTIQDLDAIIEASNRTGKLCAVDFMLSSDPGFLKLKELIRQNRLGKILRIKGAGLWKRLDSYYERTPWAGKLTFNSRYVLDGTVNNPLAHLLNNMLLLAASSEEYKIEAVTSELYHAHKIEAEDTSCIRIEGKNGLEILYYATLCHTDQGIPYICVEGANGSAVWNYNSELEMKIGDCSGKQKCAEIDNIDRIALIYENMCKVISGEEKKLFCSIHDTRNFVLASNGAFESSGRVNDISNDYLRVFSEEGSIATEIIDIGKIISKAYEAGKLYKEMEIPWAVQGKRYIMEGYKEFNMFK